ncbi:hypothetical protein CEXT_210351 [Caerostris extrusa]|uniref:Uncharacterized protein n=1 Tax=Caerostris extrusa TaxID=172846 RepID=A0AAV4P678_CAEEX|nr:hypothetical protein CEXT_210351 [Caerostris extrusa]
MTTFNVSLQLSYKRSSHTRLGGFVEPVNYESSFEEEPYPQQQAYHRQSIGMDDQMDVETPAEPTAKKKTGVFEGLSRGPPTTYVAKTRTSQQMMNPWTRRWSGPTRWKRLKKCTSTRQSTEDRPTRTLHRPRVLENKTSRRRALG